MKNKQMKLITHSNPEVFQKMIDEFTVRDELNITATQFSTTSCSNEGAIITYSAMFYYNVIPNSKVQMLKNKQEWLRNQK